MDEAAKKHALRLVPYGLYLAGTKDASGQGAESLVSWFTQTSFAPPLVVLGMHRESQAYANVKETGVLALNILGSGDGELMKSFYKHVDVEDGKAAGHTIKLGENGCPLLPNLAAALELKFIAELEGGDHAAVQFEVVEGHVFDNNAKALSHEMVGLHYAG